jgi:hypothetical protein
MPWRKGIVGGLYTRPDEMDVPERGGMCRNELTVRFVVWLRSWSYREWSSEAVAQSSELPDGAKPTRTLHCLLLQCCSVRNYSPQQPRVQILKHAAANVRFATDIAEFGTLDYINSCLGYLVPDTRTLRHAAPSLKRSSYSLENESSVTA